MVQIIKMRQMLRPGAGPARGGPLGRRPTDPRARPAAGVADSDTRARAGRLSGRSQPACARSRLLLSNLIIMILAQGPCPARRRARGRRAGPQGPLRSLSHPGGGTVTVDNRDWQPEIVGSASELRHRLGVTVAGKDELWPRRPARASHRDTVTPGTGGAGRRTQATRPRPAAENFMMMVLPPGAAWPEQVVVATAGL